MSDKARGGLFNTLGDIEGLTVLDAFAGSGALAFEAVSRGASFAVMIENDTLAQRTIETNIKKLQLHGAVKLVKASVNAWLRTADGTFDVILCDPPYDNLQSKLLEKIAEHTKPDGIIVFSSPPHATIPLSTNYQLLTTKPYGDAQLAFYRRIS